MSKVPFISLLWLWIAFPQFASSVSVRLVGGNSFEGRVEVQYNGVWGTICNNNWDMNDANVVCRMLGYQRALATTNQFGQGSGQIWLDRVTCFGSESSISSCCHKGWGVHICGHYQDAGVVCQPQAAYPDVSVRMTNNNIVSYAGQVEVRYYGVWKPICHYSWDRQDGNVVCRMMGYNQGAAAVIKSVQGSRNVWLSSVYCGGYESSIDYCSHSTWGQASCSDNSLAGVVCISGSPNIAFRLTNRIIHNEGRLEVRYYGIWGAVCTYFDQKDAHVVCRMLGYSQAALIYKQPYTNGMYRFSLEMHCNGQENSIDQCGYNINEINACGNWDVWVVCKSSVHTPNITVRLVNGNTPNKGQVEVGYQGTWGTICSYYWTLRDAQVVCRMLNYSKSSWVGTGTVKGSGPILVYGNCKGNEKSLEYCNNYRWHWHSCDHYSDVAVTCENMTLEEKSIAVRLVESDQKDTGLVEVNYNGTWRPICDDSSWDLLDAHVVCKMLGYKAALAHYRQHRRRNSNIWMGGVECSGDEVSLSECYHNGWTTTGCSNNYQAGIVCEDAAPVQVRLEDGISPNSGHVELRYGNIWGTVCYWGVDMNDAKVICRMLGYPGATRVTPFYNYPLENKTVWQNYLQCNGTETSIADCLHHGLGQRCPYYYFYSDVNVICKKADAPQFQISAPNGITDSTVDILFNVSHPFETQLKSLPFSAYQVAVKLRDSEHSSKSHTQPGPLNIKEVDYRTALELGYDSYITAEILGPDIVPNLTIGDGQVYHGYYNAPLKPERNYRIYVRTVTKTSDGKRVYGDSAFVSFQTKQKADAPKFRINGQRAVTVSSVKIQFNDSQPTETQPTSVYQVAVEKKEKERFFNSYDQTMPFIFHEGNVTMAMDKHYGNYITAEVIGPVTNLTIGDGQYYHGYYNAPLEPGCSYKIHVRTVTRSANGKQVYGHSSWVAFTTKQLIDPNPAKSTGEDNEKAPVIGLSVVIVVLIILVILALVWVILKKRRTSKDGTTNEMSGTAEIQAQPNVTTGLPESDYQSLSFSSQMQGKGGFDNPGYNMSKKKNKKKRKKSETTPELAENQVPESHYQALNFPRGNQTNGGFDNQEQAYHVSNIRLQDSNAYKINGSVYENDTC